MKLEISPDLSLPADAATQTIVVYGGKGMGKTNFGTVLLEEMARARLRFAALDPMGVMWGLRHSANGKGPGIEVLILGGRHGDMPIEPAGGSVVADLVAEEDVDVIVDISRRSDGTMWSIGERIRFVTDYCTRLYQRQGERSRPLFQLIDEAGRFCPQIIPHGSPQLAACVGAIERMVEEGRNVGIGVGLITQRSARMNKSVSELAECMVAFRTVGPRSVDAILDWLGEHVGKERWKELVEKLRALERGTALVVSPGWLGFEGLARVRARYTFDSSATPTAGKERRASGPGAKPDLVRYQQRMTETIERAKADDPKALRAEIARLKALKPPEAPPPATVMVARSVLEEGDRLLLKKVEATFVLGLEMVRDLKHGIEKRVQDEAATAAPIPWKRPRTVHYLEKPTLPPVGPARDVEVPVGGLPPSERKVLAALAQYQPGGRTKAQLALLTGYSAGAGRFNNLLGVLRSSHYVDRGDPIHITAAGLAALGDYEPLPVGRELLIHWLNKLPPSESKVLKSVADIGPAPKHEIANDTGYTAGAGRFNNILGRLRTLGLISARGDLEVSEDLR